MPLSGPDQDAYWRLTNTRFSNTAIRSELKANGYKLNSNLIRSGLDGLLLRHQLGYLCYDKCSVDELQKFVADRGIRLKKAKGTTPRRKLIGLLRAADAAPSFTKFTELPPELRVRVYDLYMDAIADNKLSRPAEPPITRASRLLRTESLPVFYSACTISVAIKGSRSMSSSFHWEVESAEYMRRLTSPKACAIRKLVVNISCADSGRRFFARIASSAIYMTVHLRAHGDSCVIDIKTTHCSLDGWDLVKGASHVKDHLAGVMKKEVRRNGVHKGQLQAFVSRAPKLARAIGEAFGGDAVW